MASQASSQFPKGTESGRRMTNAPGRCCCLLRRSAVDTAGRRFARSARLLLSCRLSWPATKGSCSLKRYLAQRVFVSSSPVVDLAQERPLAPRVYLSEQRVAFLPCPRRIQTSFLSALGSNSLLSFHVWLYPPEFRASVSSGLGGLCEPRLC